MYKLSSKKTLKITHQFIIITLIFSTALSACSKQNWYQAAQSAQTAQCLNEPQSEYADCNRQTEQSYDEYDKNREELKKDSAIQ